MSLIAGLIVLGPSNFLSPDTFVLLVIMFISCTLASVTFNNEMSLFPGDGKPVESKPKAQPKAKTQTQTQAKPKAKPKPKATAPSAAASESRDEGVVKWFNSSKGFGFITRSDGQDVFVHFRSIRGEGRRFLRDGQNVQFETGQGDKGLQAEDVVVLES